MLPATKLLFIVFFISAAFAGIANAQVVDTAYARSVLASKDTVVMPTIKNPAFKETDSSKLVDPNARIPGKAALRSAIIPGWGQIYNKKLWYVKVPIVYGALGATGGFFVYNLQWFKRFQKGVRVVTLLNDPNVITKDSSAYKALNRIVRLTYEVNGVENMRFFRDDFRKNLDYAAIYFIIAWGLNVVEATVSAHLSSFDVSPDLTFKVEPGYSAMAGTAGVSFVLKFK